jgi:hypothetical protein
MIMSDKPNDLLLLAGKIITVFMQGAMMIGAVALTIACGAVLFFQETIRSEFIAETGNPMAAFPVFALVGVMLIGLAIVTGLFAFFGRLRQIINTVGEGDPFAPANADRLNQMAWLMLGVQLLTLPAIPLAMQLVEVADEYGGGVDVSFDGGPDLSGILIVIILFILARVFRHGTAMREDLKGTV